MHVGNRPPSANNRVIMNAATGQKIGLGPGGVTGVGGLSANSAITGAGVSGVGMSSLNDPSKGLLSFNIQGTNGKSKSCP